MHVERGLLARGARLAGGGDGCRAEQSRVGEEEADGWARARKRNGSSLKFETKVFPVSKIHQIFTGDR